MSLRIKVDEDLPRIIVQILKDMGYDAVGVRGQGMGGWKDEELWKAVQAEGMFLITADKGFGDIRKYPPGTHRGILLLRPYESGIRPLVELMNRVMNSLSLEELVGTITVVTPKAIRIRRQA